MEILNIVAEEVNIEIKIKKSQFITHLKSVDNSQDAKDYISAISKIYKDATHNCWAYIIGDKGELIHCSDNGEPSGTAGKPMLGVLQKNRLTNVVVIVTRYFGGIKLGVRGLIDAYADAVQSAVSEAEIKPLIKYYETIAEVEYAYADKFKHTLAEIEAEIADARYYDNVRFVIRIAEEGKQKLTHLLLDLEAAAKIRIIR